MGNTESIDDGGYGNQISPGVSRQNTQINVLPVEEGMEMQGFEGTRPTSAGRTFAERAWKESEDGRSPSPTKMSNGTAFKSKVGNMKDKKINTKKVKEKLDQVMDYVSFFLFVRVDSTKLELLIFFTSEKRNILYFNLS